MYIGKQYIYIGICILVNNIFTRTMVDNMATPTMVDNMVTPTMVDNMVTPTMVDNMVTPTMVDNMYQIILVIIFRNTLSNHTGWLASS